MRSKIELFLLLTLVSVAISTPSAFAYRIIRVPTANILGTAELVLEADSRKLSTDDAQVYRADIGVPRVELQAQYFNGPVKSELTGGLEVSVLPETLVTPGIAVGADDLADVTLEGRSFYAVASKQIPVLDTLPSPIKDVHVHAGAGTGGLKGIFAGIEAGFPFGLGVQIEHDGSHLNYGATWSPVPIVKLRYAKVHDDTLYSIFVMPTFAFTL